MAITLTEDDKKYIQELISDESQKIRNFADDLSKASMKLRVFDLMEYGFSNYIFAHNRYVAIKSNLITDLEQAVFSNKFILLRYGDIFWTLNSFQRTHLSKYSFSFISIITDPDSNGKENYQFPIIQFMLITSNPNLSDERNVIIKKSNTIRLSDKILTNNSIYEEDIFPEDSTEKALNFEQETGLKV